MNELATQQGGTIVPMDPEQLIARAIDAGTPVETLERLLEMRRAIKEEAGRSAYYEALAAFQAECPPIQKTKQVKDRSGAVRYTYAPLDDIVKQVGPTLKDHGLSYSIKTEQVDGGVKAVCEIHHQAGHTESSSFVVPVEVEGFMNSAQKAGSALTYAKRYAFCNALGIMTTDQDDDGASLGEGVKLTDVYKRAAQHMQAVLHNIDHVMAIKKHLGYGHPDAAMEAWDELSDDVKMALWLAPTKGGCFTTQEREALREAKRGGDNETDA